MIISEVHDDLKYRVMQRIKFIYLTRKIFSPLVAEAALMVAALLVCRFWVSLGSVSTNFRVESVSFGSLANYLLSAVYHTETIVQVMMGVFLVAFILVVRNLVVEKNLFGGIKPLFQSASPGR